MSIVWGEEFVSRLDNAPDTDTSSKWRPARHENVMFCRQTPLQSSSKWKKSFNCVVQIESSNHLHPSYSFYRCRLRTIIGHNSKFISVSRITLPPGMLWGRSEWMASEKKNGFIDILMIFEIWKGTWIWNDSRNTSKTVKLPFLRDNKKWGFFRPRVRITYKWRPNNIGKKEWKKKKEEK